MTKNQAISIKVRLETAITALEASRDTFIPDEEDPITERVGECLEEALQAAQIGLVEVNKVIGP